LELEGVRFAYGDRPVLRDVRLRVEPGEAVALLGANGGGKTTLLRLASGALAPGGGRVLLDGWDVPRMRKRELARAVSVLAQELDAPSGWSVREVVELGRTPHIPWLGSPSAADTGAVEEAMRLTGTEDLAERAWETLSGGQRQRALVALAVAQAPRLLLLDEPTAHLDLKHRAALLDAVEELRGRLGLSVLAAMHDPTLAGLYFGRVALLSAGRILADGPPREVLTEPLLEAAYGAPVRVAWDPVLGAPVVNVLPARLRATPAAAHEQIV
jgi:iron complex transport system ATP-binding protein